MNDSLCCPPLTSVSGSEKLDRLDRDGNQRRSIAKINVQNDGLKTCMYSCMYSWVSLLINGFVNQSHCRTDGV